MSKKMLLALLPMTLWGCHTSHQIDTRSEVNVKPIEIKPIHITIDINVKVDRALDDFFGDIDDAKKTAKPAEIPANLLPPSAPAPAAAPAAVPKTENKPL